MEKRLMHKRLSEIVERLEKDGYVNAKELAQCHQVSMETIRKDLHILEQMGIAQKEYGGASLSILSLEKRYDFRKQNIEKKTEIAKRAVEECRQVNTIFLDAGSTCLQCVDYLNRLEDKNIITNSLLAFESLKETNNVFLTGGKKRDKNQALVGNWAEKFIQSVHADICLLGSAGIMDSTGPTTHSYQELSLKQTMILQSDIVYVLVDSTKFAQNGLHTITDWECIDGIITDHLLSRQRYDALKDRVNIISSKED
ncbi:DeoR family transcriptional regulator of aga operon [Faecalicoccus acidiformans]|uniref:DeoR family transcriptional regulator of aga operon n=1 Tax=Faecalicoccus acidiformans TaxID=915173 RepID=A0A7W8D2I5_9FIRM|nr:DeoR/GlpR family DNA-binding transcription regulator [Faecalicoccus acidiformans]MBB5185579.1 DeoR family transcriptional regulator of aga operon [Faecalicoccus acidiformans]